MTFFSWLPCEMILCAYSYVNKLYFNFKRHNLFIYNIAWKTLTDDKAYHRKTSAKITPNSVQGEKQTQSTQSAWWWQLCSSFVAWLTQDDTLFDTLPPHLNTRLAKLNELLTFNCPLLPNCACIFPSKTSTHAARKMIAPKLNLRVMVPADYIVPHSYPLD